VKNTVFWNIMPFLTIATAFISLVKIYQCYWTNL